MKISKELTEIIRQTLIQEAGEAVLSYAAICNDGVYGGMNKENFKEAKAKAHKQVLATGTKLLKLHRGMTPRIEV